jgi:hypothetical protein
MASTNITVKDATTASPSPREVRPSGSRAASISVGGSLGRYKVTDSKSALKACKFPYDSVHHHRQRLLLLPHHHRPSFKNVSNTPEVVTLNCANNTPACRGVQMINSTSKYSFRSFFPFYLSLIN